MATMGDFDDNEDRYLDKSFEWLTQERLAEIVEPGFLTVGQCALIIPAVRNSVKDMGIVATSDVAAAYLMLIQRDIVHQELEVRHPQTMLSYSEYLKMAASGMYGKDGRDMPFPDMGWLVHIDEARRWYDAKGFDVDVSNVKADMEAMRAASLDSETSENATGVAPKQRSQAQDEAILDLLQNKGYDPLALPPYVSGKRGIKAEIKAALGDKGIWSGKTVFRHAWDRLLSNGDIAYK